MPAMGAGCGDVRWWVRVWRPESRRTTHGRRQRLRTRPVPGEGPDEQAAVDAQQTQQQSLPSSGGLASGQMDQLEQLADLRDQGVLTEEEFIEQKGRILG